MGFIFKFLVCLILILCIISTIHVLAYFVITNTEQMEARDITSEGPDCRTVRWYVMEAVGRFDDLLRDVCEITGNKELLSAWRLWLKDEFNVTMY